MLKRQLCKADFEVDLELLKEYLRNTSVDDIPLGIVNLWEYAQMPEIDTTILKEKEN